jgi:septal ring factor EnvC (AmiA/AmiB activator)
MDIQLINRQRIEAYQLVAELQDSKRKLSASVARKTQANQRLRARLGQTEIELQELRAHYRYAISELSKKRPEILSDDEWMLVLESRGICG